MSDGRPPVRYLEAALGLLQQEMTAADWAVDLQDHADGGSWLGFYDGYMQRACAPTCVEALDENLCQLYGVDVPETPHERLQLAHEFYRRGYADGRATRAIMDSLLRGLEILIKLPTLPQSKEAMAEYLQQLYVSQEKA